jgi:hypothetical protein
MRNLRLLDLQDRIPRIEAKFREGPKALEDLGEGEVEESELCLVANPHRHHLKKAKKRSLSQVKRVIRRSRMQHHKVKTTRRRKLAVKELKLVVKEKPMRKKKRLGKRRIQTVKLNST